MNIGLYLSSPKDVLLFIQINKTCSRAIQSLKKNPVLFFKYSKQDYREKALVTTKTIRIYPNIETLGIELQTLRFCSKEIFRIKNYQIIAKGVLEEIDFINLEKIQSRIVWYKGNSEGINNKMNNLRSMILTDCIHLKRIICSVQFLRKLEKVQIRCEKREACDVISMVENLYQDVMVIVKQASKDLKGRVSICGCGVLGNGKDLINLLDESHYYQFNEKALKLKNIKIIQSLYLPLNLSFHGTHELNDEINADLTVLTNLTRLQLLYIQGIINLPKTLQVFIVKSSNIQISNIQSCSLKSLVIERSTCPFPFSLPSTITSLHLSDIQIQTISNFDELPLIDLSLINCRSQNSLNLPTTLRSLELDSCPFPININDEVNVLILDNFNIISQFHFPHSLTRLELGSAREFTPELSRCHLKDLKLFDCENVPLSLIPVSVTSFGIYDSLHLPKKLDLCDFFFTSIEISLCPTIQSISFPSSICSIYLESCRGLTSINLSNSLQLTQLSLVDCTSLTRLNNIPTSVQSLYFSKCHSLTEIKDLDQLPLLPQFIKDKCHKIFSCNIEKDGQSFSCSQSEQ
ncbi:leucine-rich repeat containing protein [Entamoeba histolytica HM-1:IMSS-B]|uniref:Leucine-rich repeat containing protein n=6 Tax=Entamoeba histolytica TaxID=5759 RepID=B1N5H1_ENTH1|nr:uncharacterized protein EHI_048850 [Entamoeba histolytica HM-1:IMSS]EMD46109.1 leucinerich repeat-containing protein [Entamoeba histolytica KU27]EMH75969.1 leucine-rich repeat containing protein [Entamoeba histolytica HM-1:IMSS-B]EMS11960.1 Leucine-rich repeat containing protein [Entamoeba histolytica HM-3:IMSS]ENY64362.1 Leucine-rich repeat containing protein [Entamoeba histolytica HM-1:IMSS-A]EDS88787.1 leucine-rich repeat containing protein [Entamoeba histolytica HM-1:IMSS]|eukprot:XP_001914437.1 uncharacterized protein EHI_048850 [Entamoeba histolytica HM-1:IMSS]